MPDKGRETLITWTSELLFGLTNPAVDFAPKIPQRKFVSDGWKLHTKTDVINLVERRLLTFIANNEEHHPQTDARLCEKYVGKIYDLVTTSLGPEILQRGGYIPIYSDHYDKAFMTRNRSTVEAQFESATYILKSKEADLKLPFPVNDCAMIGCFITEIQSMSKTLFDEAVPKDLHGRLTNSRLRKAVAMANFAVGPKAFHSIFF